jgi:hypothetical protein
VSPRILLPLLVVACLLPAQAQGGCTPLPAGVPTLNLQAVGGSSRMTIAYHPGFDQYYGFQGGNPGFDYEIFDGLGAHIFLSNSVGLDGRSMWYNPNTTNLELATYNAMSGGASYGLFTVGIDGSGFYTGANVQELVAVPGLASSQTCPAYDPVADVLYSRSGSGVVHVVDRQTGALTGTITLDLVTAGSPSVPTNSIGFTGIPSCAFALASNSTDAALIFDDTGAFVASVPLGFDVNTTYSGNYANGQFWVFDGNVNQWRGFLILDTGSLDVMEGAFHPSPPVPAFNEDLGVVVGQIELTAVGQTAQVTSLDLIASGTGDDAAGIALVSLVLEDQATINGVVDGLDTVVATGTYPADDGTLTLTLSPGPIDVVPGTSESMLVLYDVALGASGPAPPASFDWTLDTIAASISVTFPSGQPTGGMLVDVRCPLAFCGDCNQDGGITVLDALLAAQHGVAIVTLTGVAFSNCNVTGVVEPDPGPAVDVLDALTIAQEAAGLQPTLACCVP